MRVQNRFLAATLSFLVCSAIPQDPAQGSSRAPAGPTGVQAPVEESVEKQLRERVAAYWKTRENLNLQECYPFYESAFRAQYTPDSFAKNFRRLNRFAPEVLGIVSVAIAPSGEKATVKIKLRTHPAPLEGKELISVHEEEWVREEDGWWKAAEPLLPNF